MNNAVDNEADGFEEDKLTLEEVHGAGTEEEAKEQDSPQEILPSTFEIAGFWRRVGAFVVDAIIVSIPFFILGFAFTDISYAIGPYGVFLGYGVFILYWGYFNSSARGGQTLGKKALKIAVVNQNNEYLTLKSSYIRAVALGLIFLFSEWPFSSIGLLNISIVISTIGALGAFIILYGLIFNRTTRQGVHDLLAKSYVIKAPPLEISEAPLLPQIHKRFMVGIAVFIAVISIFGIILLPSITSGFIGEDVWDEIAAIQKELVKNEDVISADVTLGSITMLGSGQTLRKLEVELWVKPSCAKNFEHCSELVETTAQVVIDEFDVDNLDVVDIAITNRFDFGIPSGYFGFNNRGTIEDWEEHLSE